MLDTFASGFLVLATTLTAVFQIAIVFGAPLGAYSYGGSNVGKLPTRYRISSVASAAVMVAIAGHYLAQLGVFQPLLGSVGNSVVNWVLVGFFALSAVMNNISKSRKERMVWGATTILMFFASLIVALNF